MVEQPLRSAAGVVLLSASDEGEARRWDDLVSRAPVPDAYFRPGYVAAYEAAGHGRAVALLAGEAPGTLLVPLLVRDLSGVPGAAALDLDAITAYGYGGVLPLHEAQPSAEQAEAALRAVQGWCAENGVISVLFRLHPLLAQQTWLSTPVARLEGFELRPSGPTLVIDLARWTEAAMRKDRRKSVRAARQALRVTWSPGDGPPVPEALRIFRRIYEATMDRLHASSFYFFPSAHYDALVRGLGEGLGLAIAWCGEEAVAAYLFLADRTFGHTHLSGSTPRGNEHGASSLLVAEGLEWARTRGCRLVHLGGGTAAGDSLYEFKRSFGGTSLEYWLMTLVADPARHAALVSSRQAAGGSPPRPAFFPAYRG